ncbi:hypothetical protein N9937_01610 [bacterium]|nr:hypothetical protein [bacterium]
MTQYRHYGTNDEQDATVLDLAFRGVDARRDPRQLEPGLVSEAINKNFILGSADKRLGFRTQTWGSEFGVDFPIDFTFDFYAMGFQTVWGGEVFSDPNRQEGVLIPMSTLVRRLRANSVPESIGLPDDVTLDADVSLTQAFDRVLMWRGEDKTPLVWNPQEDFTDGLGDFTEVTMSTVRGSDPDNTFGAGDQVIPPSVDGTLHANRIWVIVGKDQLIASDILDYTRFNEINQRFRINAGSDDAIVKTVSWADTELVVFKDQSIFILKSAFGDLGDIFRTTLTEEFGLVGKDAWAMVGRDIWFMSSGGVRSIAYTDQNELQAIAQPLSGPIQPIIERINWSYKSKIQCIAHDNKFYAAVPLDQSQSNNAILIYDVVNQAWAGYWTASFLDVKRFVRTDYAGKRRLFIVNGNDTLVQKAKGAFMLVGDGFTDDLYSDEYEIVDQLTTRGYAAGTIQDKRFQTTMFVLKTWNPNYTVKAISDGANEENILRSAITKDRAKYYTFGKADYDESNVNDDHGDPYREDYSVLPAVGDGPDPGANGINPNLRQRTQETARINRFGEWVQFQIATTQGHANLVACGIGVQAGRRVRDTKS